MFRALRGSSWLSWLSGCLSLLAVRLVRRAFSGADLVGGVRVVGCGDLLLVVVLVEWLPVAARRADISVGARDERRARSSASAPGATTGNHSTNAAAASDRRIHGTPGSVTLPAFSSEDDEDVDDDDGEDDDGDEDDDDDDDNDDCDCDCDSDCGHDDCNVNTKGFTQGTTTGNHSTKAATRYMFA